MKARATDAWFTIRYRRHVLRENAWSWLARRLPRPLLRAAVVWVAVKATTPPYVQPGEYAGPDGLDYKRMWEAA